MRAVLGPLAFILLALLPTRTDADIAPNPITGGWPISPYDQETTDVRMVAEDVLVRIYPDSVVTVAVFSMHNDVKSMDMTVGFPFRHENDVLAFRAFVDGKTLKVRDGSKHHSQSRTLGDSSVLDEWTTYWKLWDITFREGKNCEIRVEYTTKSNERGFYWFQERDHPSLPAHETVSLNKAMDARHAEYILDTGRAWKGNLDHCKVTFELVGLTADHIGRYQPGDGVIAGNRIIWDYTDYEPRGFVNIEYLPLLTKAQRRDSLLAAANRFPDDVRLVYDVGRYADSYADNHDVECEVYHSFLTKWNKPIPQLLEYAPGGRCRVNPQMEGGFIFVFSIARGLFQNYKQDGQLEKGRDLAPKLSVMSQAIIDSLATCSSADKSAPWLIKDATELRNLCKDLLNSKK
jgi:hypothetical protein